MREPSVMLIAMPWHALGLPSIQLGILAGVLEQAGIATELRSLMLAFMEHCLAETAARPEAEGGRYLALALPAKLPEHV